MGSAHSTHAVACKSCCCELLVYFPFCLIFTLIYLWISRRHVVGSQLKENKTQRWHIWHTRTPSRKWGQKTTSNWTSLNFKANRWVRKFILMRLRVMCVRSLNKILLLDFESKKRKKNACEYSRNYRRKNSHTSQKSDWKQQKEKQRKEEKSSVNWGFVWFIRCMPPHWSIFWSTFQQHSIQNWMYRKEGATEE